MNDIEIAFWNRGNLFDVKPSPIAMDLEFTPDRGWTSEVLSKKIEKIGNTIKLMHNNSGPELLGLCEIENVQLFNGPLINEDDNEINSLKKVI